MSHEQKTDEHEQAAGALYDRNAATPLPPPRKGEFHSWNPVSEILKQRGPELYAQTGMDTAAQRQLDETFRTIGRATGLPDTVLAQIADGHLGHLLAGARVSEDPDGDDLALSQRIAASNAELREHFTRAYGAKDGEQLLERTQRYIRKHPALAKMLQQRGLGSDPEIVKGVAGHVFSTGWRG